jgi:hypothetical protein
MARYLLKMPAFIDGDYIAAHPEFPTEKTFPDDMPPSRTWIPLDAAAVAALKRIGVEAKIGEAPARRRPNPRADQVALSEAGKSKRAADREP